MKQARDRRISRVAARDPRTLIVMMRFLADVQHWIGADPRMAARVLRLVIDVARDPREGIGKPERLRHSGEAVFSRRIDDEHRLLYRYDDEQIEYLAARFHYAP